MAVRIAAGDLNRRIQLQARTEARDGAGNATNTWTTFATVWASIAPLSGLELERAKAFEASVSHRVSIRHRDDVTEKHRALYGDRVFLINAVIDVESQQIRDDLYCEEYRS
jgi:SPP1 family predicted phage head-tail adaptor